MGLSIQSTTVKSAADGGARVEILLADTADIATATESVQAALPIKPAGPLLLEEAQLDTLLRIRAAIDPLIESLRRAVSEARGKGR